MEVTSRAEADTPHIITQFKASHLGPGSYETQNLDISYTQARKSSLRKSLEARISPSKDSSTLSSLSHVKSIKALENQEKIIASKSKRRLFKLFSDQSKSMADNSPQFQLIKEMQARKEKQNSNRLNLESTATSEEVGPGVYNLEKNTIRQRLEDWMIRKEHCTVRNNYQNYVFPSRVDFLGAPVVPVSEQLNNASHIKRGKVPRPAESKEASPPPGGQPQETDYVRSKLAKLGSLYDKIRLRESLAAGSLHPEPHEYRKAPMPALDIYN